MNRKPFCFLLLALWMGGLVGCGGGGGDSGLQNGDPGRNDIGVVVAFGDSLTRGTECECDPYPRRLAPMIEKSVLNTGVAGSMATDNVDRTQEAIDKYQPGFMLILYGVNDVIHGFDISSITEALDQMVSICKTNHVVPVLATYPEPIGDRAVFAFRTLVLNIGIRDLAATRGIPCVDLELEFKADPVLAGPALFGEDGLHPNDAGTQIIALAFADLF